MSDKPKNVQIPLELFNALLDTLEYIDVSNYTEDFKNQFEWVFDELKDKKKRMDLREDYGRLLAANKSDDLEKQTDARIEYLRNKNKNWC
jgi:hypothetical protein